MTSKNIVEIKRKFEEGLSKYFKDQESHKHTPKYKIGDRVSYDGRLGTMRLQTIDDIKYGEITDVKTNSSGDMYLIDDNIWIYECEIVR